MEIGLRRILGYLGLLPFIAFSVIPLLVAFPEGYVFNLLLSFYGGVILSFLGGMTWSWTDNSKSKLSLISGITFSLIGFFIITISNMFLFYSLCLGLVGFILFYLFELRVSKMMLNTEYRNLRTILTASVSICYLVAISTYSW